MTSTDLHGLLARFLTAKEASNRAPDTINWYERQISHFLLWLDAMEFMGDDLPELIDRYMAEEHARGLAPRSVSARFRALSAWLNWCTKRKLMSESPMQYVEKPRVPKTQQPYVTLAECNRLLASIGGEEWTDIRDRLILLLLFYSGLRSGELIALATGDIDTKAYRLTVRQGKGMKSRVVPIHPSVRKHVLAYLYARPLWDGPELLLSSDGVGNVRGALTKSGLRQMLERRCEKAKLRNLNPHAWRHGFAMWALNTGMPMSGVSTLMGHSSSAVTESVYAHWLLGDLHREYDVALTKLAG